MKSKNYMIYDFKGTFRWTNSSFTQSNILPYDKLRCFSASRVYATYSLYYLSIKEMNCCKLFAYDVKIKFDLCLTELSRLLILEAIAKSTMQPCCNFLYNLIIGFGGCKDP